MLASVLHAASCRRFCEAKSSRYAAYVHAFDGEEPSCIAAIRRASALAAFDGEEPSCIAAIRRASALAARALIHRSSTTRQRSPRAHLSLIHI